MIRQTCSDGCKISMFFRHAMVFNVQYVILELITFYVHLTFMSYITCLYELGHQRAVTGRLERPNIYISHSPSLHKLSRTLHCFTHPQWMALHLRKKISALYLSQIVLHIRTGRLALARMNHSSNPFKRQFQMTIRFSSHILIIPIF